MRNAMKCTSNEHSMGKKIFQIICVVLLNLVITEIPNNIPIFITLNRRHFYYGVSFEMKLVATYSKNGF